MKIIVLLAAMTRGGIDLLQSLLDKHTQFSQFPGKFYIDEFLKKIKDENDNLKIVKHFIDDHKEYFDSKLNVVERHNCLGKNRNEFYLINKDKFIKKFIELSRNKKLIKRDIIINLHLSYSYASGEDLSKKKLIILQVHHLFRINSIADLDFDITCTIRDPIASHSSFVKNLSVFENKYINPWQYNYHIERNFSHLIELCKLKKKISVIKLERLHKNNLEVMRNFCRRYDINYEKNLQNSTFQGKLWWGDKVSKKFLNGVNPNFENSIDDSSFSKNDISILEYFLENYIKKYNYTFKSKVERIGFKKYLPLKIEKIILFQSIKNLNLKNLILCFYYYIKKFKFMKKSTLDKFEYPTDL